MLRFIVTALSFACCITTQAQEDEMRYALPPGPARVGGFITQNGQPVEATVRLKCRIEGKQLKRDFKTYGRGEYTAYIPPHAKNPVLTLIVQGRKVGEFRPEYWGEGSVSQKDWEVPVDP